MSNYLKDNDIINLLKSKINYSCNQKQLAKEMGVSPAYLSDLLKGNRGFSDRVLKYLKMKKVYIRVRK